MNKYTLKDYLSRQNSDILSMDEEYKICNLLPPQKNEKSDVTASEYVVIK